MSSLNIAVLSGGISHEREVSLRSGRRVADALTARGHNVTIIDPDANLFATLKNLNPDVVWPAGRWRGPCPDEPDRPVAKH